MDQPQSDEEIRPVVEALRRLDPLLDLRWNPRAVLANPGHFDARGHRVSATYDGRWEIVRHHTATALHDNADHTTVITMVTELSKEPGPPAMLHHGGYAPVGMWLVEYMEVWDTAQRHFATHMDALWAQHERAEAGDLLNERAAHQEAAERVYREHGGGQYWMGRGFGPGQRPRAVDPSSPSRSTV